MKLRIVFDGEYYYIQKWSWLCFKWRVLPHFEYWRRNFLIRYDKDYTYSTKNIKDIMHMARRYDNYYNTKLTIPVLSEGETEALETINKI